MSRSQEGQAFNTASNQNRGYFNESQNSFANAQSDLGDFENGLKGYAGDVASFAAKNPFVQGGEFQTAENQQLANTADASAQAAGQRLQGQALRTGQNTAGAIAATENMQQQNERNLAGQEAKATQQRIGSEANYNNQALKAQEGLTQLGEFPVTAEASMAGEQGRLGEGDLGEEVNAGKMPSWMDQFGDMLGEGLAEDITGGGAREMSHIPGIGKLG